MKQFSLNAIRAHDKIKSIQPDCYKKVIREIPDSCPIRYESGQFVKDWKMNDLDFLGDGNLIKTWKRSDIPIDVKKTIRKNSHAMLNVRASSHTENYFITDPIYTNLESVTVFMQSNYSNFINEVQHNSWTSDFCVDHGILNALIDAIQDEDPVHLLSAVDMEINPSEMPSDIHIDDLIRFYRMINEFYSIRPEEEFDEKEMLQFWTDRELSIAKELRQIWRYSNGFATKKACEPITCSIPQLQKLITAYGGENLSVNILGLFSL